MTDPNRTQPRQIIGMDFVAPYGVYVDGECIAEYETQAQALAHFDSLVGRQSHNKPAQAAGEL